MQILVRYEPGETTEHHLSDHGVSLPPIMINFHCHYPNQPVPMVCAIVHASLSESDVTNLVLCVVYYTPK